MNIPGFLFVSFILRYIIDSWVVFLIIIITHIDHSTVLEVNG